MPVHASPLLTDLYQLTMLQAYFDAQMHRTAVFEFFVRRMPPARNFLLAAGLDPVLDYLETLAMSPEDVAAVRRLGGFHEPFLDWLAGLRFTGDVSAMPEGSVFFPDEPILRVTAPLPQAQFVETRIVNLLHFSTLVASKAARCVLAAPGRTLVDFGLRRAHGAEAGLLAARSAYLAGFTGTATVQAGVEFGVPVFGTMAHSFVQAHGDETRAFAQFARSHPDNVTLLIDTYDTEEGARKVAELSPLLATEGIRIRAVRIDSGDLADHANKVRAILDAAGAPHIGIFASSSLDEHELAELFARGAPIDGVGVGTRLTTSSDVPYLDCVYKLQAYDGRPMRKRSEGKATWPGTKQVHRAYAADGTIEHDVIALADEPPAGEPLLARVMAGGVRVGPRPALLECREHAARMLAQLPQPLRSLAPAPPFTAAISPALRALADEVDRTAH